LFHRGRMDNISVELVTWNVGTQFPSEDGSLARLLGDSRPDLLLLGLQEVKSQPQNLVADTVLAGEDPWTGRLRQHLAPLGYVKVRSIRLVGIVLSLFCLTRHLPHLRGLETQYTRLGFGGYWGSKGVVSVRFRLYGVSVCVLNSHLAAHTQFNQDRIDSYNSVLGGHGYSEKETELILYHDYVFWLGDLNFRLDTDLEFGEVTRLVSRGELGKLLALDQLSIARSNGAAFSEFRETLPTFPPSYKYKMGSSIYDSKRLPAWTDRILYKANTANYENYSLEALQHSYTAHLDFLESDHKPVTSDFTIRVFSQKIAADLLLPAFGPVVSFLEAGPYFVGEDTKVVYTCRIEQRKHLTNWDWIGLYRADSTNLEDYLAYTWASTRLVRDSVFEVLFDESTILVPGQFKLVYFTSGARDVYGVSKPFHVRAQRYGVEVGAEPAQEATERGAEEL